MSKEVAISKTININRQGQMVMFEIRLPKAAESVIGVELGWRWISGNLPLITPANDFASLFYPVRDTMLGELSLQSYDNANCFYSRELSIDNNEHLGDFTRQFFAYPPYSQPPKTNEDVIWVSGTATIIKGAYRDKLFEMTNHPYAYQVRMYVWLKRKEISTPVLRTAEINSVTNTSTGSVTNTSTSSVTK